MVSGAHGKGCPPSALVLFEMPRHALHRRESSGLAWGAWLMDLRQDWRGGSAKHLRWSSVALVTADRGKLPSGGRVPKPSGVFRSRESLLTLTVTSDRMPRGVRCASAKSLYSTFLRLKSNVE